VLSLAARAGIGPGDRILDAGCGVAGPAMMIAGHYPGVVIDGVTISRRQAAIAASRIREAGLSSRVRVHLADFQAIPFPNGGFEQVLFLESTGYATDLDVLFGEAHRVLAPGGRLYVKDVFCRPGPLRTQEAKDLETFDRLWGCVRSKTMEESCSALTRAGFEVLRSDPMPDVGTARLLGAMYEFDNAHGLRLSELGRAFWRKGLDPPIIFGEINAVG
jgi:cyclopropane fatty-acyl-phospholipid synthase-like methyltransferase